MRCGMALTEAVKTVKDTWLLGATEEGKDAVQQQAWELRHLLS